MRRILRALGTLMIVAGVATLGWAIAVWKWEDPFTSLVTSYEQRGLSSGLDERFVAYRRAHEQAVSSGPIDLVAEAKRYRRSTKVGEAAGRLVVPRLGVDMVFVYGTDTESLKKGPGLDGRTSFPGLNALAYIAGHRTTYGAPFAKIDSLRKGDEVRVEMPYATFAYTVTGSRIVGPREISVLESNGYEQVALQACHPRFFASHRWITYGKLESVKTPDGKAIALSATGSG